jgi:uncharacterized repeat protein (TIGR01451 family)
MLILLSLITYVFAQITREYNPLPGNANFTDTVPNGTCLMELEVRGGKGGNGHDGINEVLGGNGGLVSAIFSVNGGENYDGRVGVDGNSGGGGGGSSGIRLNNNLLALAGGGGGGGGYLGVGGAGGGKGGLPNGADGIDGNGGGGQGNFDGAGGTNGLGGTRSGSSSGGGGGVNGDGTSSNGNNDPNGGKSYASGGNGSTVGTPGGNGYTGGGSGAGGGGGGGGGWSGGGGGYSGGGGGGGNFINSTNLFSSFHNGDTNDPSLFNGSIKIKFHQCPTSSSSSSVSSTFQVPHSNTANVSGNTNSGPLSSNVTLLTNVSSLNNLTLTKSSYVLNNTIFYQIMVKNTGLGNITNVTIQDTNTNFNQSTCSPPLPTTLTPNQLSFCTYNQTS